jgi:hypothetical protein
LELHAAAGPDEGYGQEFAAIRGAGYTSAQLVKHRREEIESRAPLFPSDASALVTLDSPTRGSDAWALPMRVLVVVSAAAIADSMINMAGPTRRPAVEAGAPGIGQRISGSQETRRWRGMNSKFQFRARSAAVSRASIGLGPIDSRRGGIIRAVVGPGKPIELLRWLKEPPLTAETKPPTLLEMAGIAELKFRIHSPPALSLVRTRRWADPAVGRSRTTATRLRCRFPRMPFRVNANAQPCDFERRGSPSTGESSANLISAT